MQPAHPSPGPQGPGGHDDVVVEPAGQLDPGAVPRELVDQWRDGRVRPERLDVVGVCEHGTERQRQGRLGGLGSSISLHIQTFDTEAPQNLCVFRSIDSIH